MYYQNAFVDWQSSHKHVSIIQECTLLHLLASQARFCVGALAPPNLGLAFPRNISPYGAKRSVLWPSKYTKMCFPPGLCPRLHWGSS